MTDEEEFQEWLHKTHFSIVPSLKDAWLEKGKRDREKIEKIREAYEEYISLLNAELNDVVGLAYVHGWRSQRVEQGKQVREKIKELLEEMK